MPPRILLALVAALVPGCAGDGQPAATAPERPTTTTSLSTPPPAGELHCAW